MRQSRLANVVGGRQSRLVQLIEERQSKDSKLSTGARKETNRMLKYSRDSLSMCALKPRAPKETAKISTVTISTNSKRRQSRSARMPKETVTISTNSNGDSHDQDEFQRRVKCASCRYIPTRISPHKMFSSVLCVVICV